MMIEWGLAQKVGTFVLNAGPGQGGTGLAGALDELAADASERVIAYTGLQPVTALPAPEAIDRAEWLEANLGSMRALIEPLAAKLQRKGALQGPAKVLGGVVAGAEVGALAGYLAQRVLGQYELVLLDAARPARLLFVAPNLREAAQRLEVDEAEMVTWVTIHEVTHAVQFTGVPWLREHLADLIQQLVDSVDVKVNTGALLKLPNVDDVKALVERVREGGLITLVAGPERRAVLDRIQATMAVVEGHAEHVMDAVGEDVLPNLDELRGAMTKRRRERHPALRLFEKLIGLELKMRQYEVGKRFCDVIVEAEGPVALQRMFESPASMPTLAELDAPDAWLRRTGAQAA